MEKLADSAKGSQAAIIPEPAADRMNPPQQITNELDIIYKHEASLNNKKNV